jgi:hypothetical protein
VGLEHGREAAPHHEAPAEARLGSVEMNELRPLVAEVAGEASDLADRVRARRPASGPNDMATAGLDNVARERADVARQKSCDRTRHGDVEPACDLIRDERSDDAWHALFVWLCDVENSQWSLLRASGHVDYAGSIARFCPGSHLC